MHNFKKFNKERVCANSSEFLEVALNLFSNCHFLLSGDVFVNKHYLTSAFLSRDSWPITAEQLCIENDSPAVNQA